MKTKSFWALFLYVFYNFRAAGQETGPSGFRILEKCAIVERATIVQEAVEPSSAGKVCWLIECSTTVCRLEAWNLQRVEILAHLANIL